MCKLGLKDAMGSIIRTDSRIGTKNYSLCLKEIYKFSRHNKKKMEKILKDKTVLLVGKDDFCDKIGKGVYVYKLTVKSTLTNSKTEKFEKLVIL